MGGPVYVVDDVKSHYDKTKHVRYLTYSSEVWCIECEEIDRGKNAPGMDDGAQPQDWMGG